MSSGKIPRFFFFFLFPLNDMVEWGKNENEKEGKWSTGA